MLLRIDVTELCRPLPTEAASTSWFDPAILGLVLSIWLVVGITVFAYNYWQVSDAEAEGYIPDQWVYRVELLLVFLILWPMVLWWMYQDYQVRRTLDSYRTVGGRGYGE